MSIPIICQTTIGESKYLLSCHMWLNTVKFKELDFIFQCASVERHSMIMCINNISLSCVCLYLIWLSLFYVAGLALKYLPSWQFIVANLTNKSFINCHIVLYISCGTVERASHASSRLSLHTGSTFYPPSSTIYIYCIVWPTPAATMHLERLHDLEQKLIWRCELSTFTQIQTIAVYWIVNLSHMG